MDIIEPKKEYLNSYIQACRETFGHVHNNYIIHDPEKSEIWQHTIFDDYKNSELGINLPDGYMPNKTYWIVDKCEYIGTINIRLKLNDILRIYGGSIGIMIRLNARNKGYAKKAFAKSIVLAKKLGLKEILVSCFENNIYSHKILLNSPYKSCESRIVEFNGKCQRIWRFFF